MNEMSLVEQTRQCAGLFRLGRDVEAALFMVEVGSQVQSRVESAGSEVLSWWSAVLMRMLDCQERQDWLALADYMEYELVDLLGAVSSG